MFSRNSSSSRAIPNTKLRARVEQGPVFPVWWGKNQSGMQANEELDSVTKVEAMTVWTEARNAMLEFSEKLGQLGVHKQIANRLLEPWMFITVIITATEYDNFFFQRTPLLEPGQNEFLDTRGFLPDFPAQPEIQKIARMMWLIRREAIPDYKTPGDWHLPFITSEERQTLDDDSLVRLSVARCARVSYLNHDGVHDPEADKKLYLRLSGQKHWSPFEHVAQACEESDQHGNLFGWKQYRKDFPDENMGRKLD
jgi:hypothetical protein